jgi:hypothetical protein
MGSSLLLKGGTSTPKSIVESFSLANSFVAGDAIRYDIPSSTWVKAQADSAENSEVAGVVSSASFNTFDLTYAGLINVSALSGVTAPVLFLDSTIAGGLTTSPPSAIGTVIKPVLTKTTNGSGYIVTNYLGTQIGGSSTVAIDEIQPVGTIMPFAGSAIPDSWLACDGNSYAVGTYPNLYAKLQNSSGDRVPAYGYVLEIGVNTTISQYATWLSQVTVGDTILYDPTQVTLLQSAVTTYALIGRVLAKGTASVTVQVFPKYDLNTKNFVVPNVIPSTVGWLAAFAPVANNTIYDFLNNTYRRGEAQLASSAQVYTVSVTHFNTPDLRGRFAIGTNTTRLPAINDLEGDGANYSAISAIYSMGSQGGEEKNSLATAGALTSTGTNCVANVANNLLNNIPPYTVVRYIIKATPYTRAAIIDGIDIPYTSLLVSDLRDGSLRPNGSGEDLLFKTNDGSSGVERMRLTNTGNLLIGTTFNQPGHKFVVSSANGMGVEFLPGYIGNGSVIQAYDRSSPGTGYTTLRIDAEDFIFNTVGSGSFTINNSGQANITATIDSTSPSTGVLTLGGGLGMAKNLTVGGGISAAGGITFSGLTRLTNTTAATSPTVAAFTVVGGIGAGSLHVGAGGQSIAGPLNVTSAGAVNMASAVASNSTTSGALTVVGGVGIGGALYVGGITTAGGISMGGALTVGGGITAARLDCSGVMKSGSITTGAFSATSLAASATTPSTTTGSGALVVGGGAGIGGALNVGGGITAASLDLGTGAIKSGPVTCGNITSSGTFSATTLSATSNTASTSTGSGALVVAGGVGIGGLLNATTIVASGNITAFSDSRFKEDIKTIENALEKTQALNGVSYTDKASKEKRIGLIAQEIKEVIPEVVFVNGDDQIHSVAYGNLVGLLVQAIKELNAKVDRLSAKVETLSSGGSE